MRGKHLLPLGIALSLALLTVAVDTYPGGNQISANAVGFDWKQNYLCNLFDAVAVNGAPNSARIWAIGGWFLFFAILSILIAYATATVYYTRFHLEILPTLQKATLVVALIWILSLHYFTTREDFAPRPISP
jgi:hypothetical protein